MSLAALPLMAVAQDEPTLEERIASVTDGLNFVWTFATTLILFLGLKYTVGLRVSEEEEIEGLDFGEHGASAYPNFEVSFLN